jgi:uncharacterized protein (TIGR02646 family)
MKRIEKSASPKELTQWCTAQGNTNCRYSNLPSDIRAIVKQRLLHDQGHICCYTGIRISDRHSHIEHLKPQSRYYEKHEDVDYQNLFAAYPGSDFGQCGYGAHPKSDWYDEDQLISPLSAQCEQAFQFNQYGKITAHPHHPSAKTTIEQLKLDNQSLAEMRAQAIDEFLFESKISVRKAQDFLKKIYDRNTKGQFRPFCFVLKQACEEYIRRGKQKQTRNKAMRSQKPS